MNDSLNSGFPKVGTRLGNYDLERTLGQGGMGAVFVGRLAGVGARHAIKVLLMDRRSSAARSERFAREARALARIEPHPGVVSLHSYDVRPDGVAYLAMDLVEGQDLEQVLEAGPMPVERVLAIASGVADALVHIHRAGVIHRDLKPANILLRAVGGAPVLTDFGVARDEAEERITLSQQVLGTPRYMAPEQAVGQRAQVGPHTDVFALGITLYQALTGTFPFEGSSMIELAQALLYHEPDPPSARRREVSPDVDALVLSCLARDTDARPSAELVQRALHAIARGEASPLRRSSALARAVRRGLEHRAPILAGVGGVLLVGAVLVAGVQHSPPTPGRKVTRELASPNASKPVPSGPVLSSAEDTRKAQAHLVAAVERIKKLDDSAARELARARELDPEVASAGALECAERAVAAYQRQPAELQRVVDALVAILREVPLEPLPSAVGDVLRDGAEALAARDDARAFVDCMELLLRLDPTRTLSDTKTATWLDLTAVRVLNDQPRLTCELFCVSARANLPGFLSDSLVWKLERTQILEEFEASRLDDWAAVYLRARSLVYVCRHRVKPGGKESKRLAREALSRFARVRELSSVLPPRVEARMTYEELQAYEQIERIEAFLARAQAVYDAGHPDAFQVCNLVCDSLKPHDRPAEQVLWGKRSVDALERRIVEIEETGLPMGATPLGRVAGERARCYEDYVGALIKNKEFREAKRVIEYMAELQLKPDMVGRMQANLYATQGDYPKAIAVLDALRSNSDKVRAQRQRYMRRLRRE